MDYYRKALDKAVDIFDSKDGFFGIFLEFGITGIPGNTEWFDMSLFQFLYSMAAGQIDFGYSSTQRHLNVRFIQ